jgi:porphobilinogen synthase
MPGVERLSVDLVAREAAEARDDGVRAVLLFGVPESKDERGSRAWAEDGVVQRAVRAIRERVGDMVVVTDVCLCEYTSHGHCGLVEDGEVLNDPTLELLARQAVSHARAGADVVAPSDMMDGRIGAVRRALDDEGFRDTAILSYAAKYASAFYGPFRDAAGSAPAFGDRRGYQMDPANGDEALREVELDVEEGADIVMVKPALGYLDVVHRVKERFGLPTAAYMVSGEHAMIRAAGQQGWIDDDAVMREAVLAIRRAGADLVVTYAARELARHAGGHGGREDA